MAARLSLIGVFTLISITVVLGVLSLLLFGVFLIAGPFSFYDFGTSVISSLIINALLSIFFFVQHSGMVRESFSRYLLQFMPSHYHKIIYALSSSIALIAVMFFWQSIGDPLFVIDGLARYFLQFSYLLVVLWFIWSMRSITSFDAFGIRPILNYLQGAAPVAGQLQINGPYRWVRHPLYTGVLYLIWVYPEPTVDRLLFNCIWSIWIVFGTIWEERDLVREFGDPYRQYQSQVSMLIPFVKRSGM